MSRVKSLMISTLSTITSILGSTQKVYARELTPVGGVASTVNKLAIIAPYLVLAGIVAVGSAIYIKRRKH
ncbi:QVPTGV class sortase B protein-sorting domain-containing protein [[Eubacterium] cellulosolvens]